MIPVRLQIVGFLSYHNPVEIDFTGFDIACISGSNGAGKSSILDAITWVLFGEARRHDDAVINQRTQRENKPAKITLDFEYEGSLYRVQRSKQKDKTTTLDFYVSIKDDRWKSLTASTLRSTEEYIQQTLHLDYETFVNASFFLQGKADMFAQQKPSDRKRILSSILRLDVWEEYKEETASRRRSKELVLARCESLLSEIGDELKTEEQRKITLRTLTKEHEEANKLLTVTKDVLDKQRLIEDHLKIEEEQLAKQNAEVRRLRFDLHEKAEELNTRKEEQTTYLEQISNENEIRKGYAEWSEYNKILDELNAVAIEFHKYSAERETVIAQIDSVQKILQFEEENLTRRESEITTLEHQCGVLNKQIEEYKGNIVAVEKILKVKTELEHKLQELEVRKSKYTTEIATFEEHITELKDNKNALEQPDTSVCPTCDRPLGESEINYILNGIEEHIAEYTKIISADKDTYSECVRSCEEIDKELSAIGDKNLELILCRKNLDVTSEKLRQYEEEIKTWYNEGAVRLEEVQFKLRRENYAIEEHDHLSKINELINGLQYDEEEHKSIKITEHDLQEYQQKLQQLEVAKSSLNSIEREVKTLEKSVEDATHILKLREEEYEAADVKLSRLHRDTTDIQELEDNYENAQKNVNELLRQLGAAKGLVDELEDVKVQKVVKEMERDQIITSISQLKILEKAFGKDGIPTLLIEQALPDIEAHANEILDRLSDSTMQLSFETQRDFKDANRRDRKETLDIMISSSSEERAYELLSGGEAFRINFALRLALSHILANRSGARLSTLVIDEGFGSQDAEGRQRLIEAINSVREDFAKILVITHLEELKDAFSTRIEVSKHTNGSQVQVVLA
ncbi:MAG: SMC family ATPase [Clostridia bacterium]